MKIEELLAISSEIQATIRTYLSETADYGEVIQRRTQDVTRKIDLFAEEALQHALQRRNRCARIISEELGDRVYPAGGEPEFTLIFDPIDGSTNATLDIPFFCSSIAYSSNVEHVTFNDVHASVVAATYGKTFYAVKGEHAWVEGIQLPRALLGKTKRVFSIYTYGADSLPEAMIDFLKENRNKVIRVLGSIALEICLVAEGVLDAVVDVRNLINGYDIAGAALILKEAGGRLTDVEGKVLKAEVGMTHNVSLIAALKPDVYTEMRDMMR